MPLAVDQGSAAELLPENLWGYGKRLRFVHGQAGARFGTSCVSVLDIGCGNGSQLAVPLSRLGYRVTGVDPHGPSIERARAMCAKAEFLCGHVSDVPPQKFDVVIISEVLEHLHHPEALLSEALQLLAPGGLLIVTIPNGYGEFELDWRLYRALGLARLFNVLRRIRDRVRKRESTGELPSSDDTSGHVQRFSLRRINTMFSGLGLRVIARRPTSFVSGALIAHTLGHVPGFIELNVQLADHLPMWASSGWMFALCLA
jgi:SAM-dependent methyltransferase